MIRSQNVPSKMTFLYDFLSGVHFFVGTSRQIQQRLHVLQEISG